MRVLMSHLGASGHLVVVRVPDHLALHAKFVDEDQVRDLTGLCAALLLAGAVDVHERAEAGVDGLDETMAIAALSWVFTATPTVWESPSATWLHLPSGEAGDFDPAQTLGMIARGITIELTSGVAHEAVAGQDLDPADADQCAGPAPEVPGGSS